VAAPHELADLTAGFKRRLGLFQMVVKLHRLDSFSQLRLQRGAEHLYELGPRALAEFIAEIGDAPGRLKAIDQLAAYRRLSPDMLRATGGSRFPRHLVEVPR